MTNDYRVYTDLIESFVSERCSADEFEREYLRIFKSDQTPLPDPIFYVLDELFADVDAYCGDDSIRTTQDLDGPQLRARAASALSRLRKVLEETPR